MIPSGTVATLNANAHVPVLAVLGDEEFGIAHGNFALSRSGRRSC
jgi:hypothetical protein